MIFSAISIFYTFNFSRSIIYWVWPVFNFIALFVPFYILSRLDFNQTLQGVLLSCRLTSVIGIVLWILGYHERLQSLLYESSYFSIALSIYFIYFIYNFSLSLKKLNIFDSIIVALCLIGSKSAMLLGVFILGFTFRALMSLKSSKKFIKTISAIIFTLSLAFYYISNNNDLLSNSLHLIYRSIDEPELLLERSGNRYPRFVLATEVISKNPFGVGVGAYIDHIDNVQYASSSAKAEWLDPSSKPAINIYIEIAATSGWISALIFMGWQAVTIFRARRCKENEFVVLISFIVMILLLQLESNYLRPYFWCVWGMLSALIQRRHKL
nr:hypothetical protein [Vibrio splendidus]PMI70696.1 hypothetical protein BCU37_07435 [Vibrio splendidus]